MTRLIRADILKLRRRRGMVALWSRCSSWAPSPSTTASDCSSHGQSGAADFDDAIGVLALIASVVGVIIGATAGGADIESGVFRDLVATGRSRTALFFARVPAAWALTLGAARGRVARRGRCAWRCPAAADPDVAPCAAARRCSPPAR